MLDINPSEPLDFADANSFYCEEEPGPAFARPCLSCGSYRTTMLITTGGTVPEWLCANCGAIT